MLNIPEKKIVISGASGFIGRQLIAQLYGNFELHLLSHSRQIDQQNILNKFFQVHDINKKIDLSIFKNATFIHLGWPYLENFFDLRHLTEALPQQIIFFEKVIKAGVNKILISGTCLEYGLQEGALDISLKTEPVLPYSIAKNALHDYLRARSNIEKFNLIWTRLFYVYGDGQKANSLIPLLQKAIDRGDKSFPMSEGNQERDFVHISCVAEQLMKLIKSNNNGTFNICSGQPQSVTDFIIDYLEITNQSISLEKGRFEIPSYEPKNFWGVPNVA